MRKGFRTSNYKKQSDILSMKKRSGDAVSCENSGSVNRGQRLGNAKVPSDQSI